MESVQYDAVLATANTIIRRTSKEKLYQLDFKSLQCSLSKLSLLKKIIKNGVPSYFFS